MQKLFQQRRKQLSEKIAGSVAIVFSGREMHYPDTLEISFHPNSNFYYLTGITTSESLGIITTTHPEHSFVLFCHLPDAQKAIWDGPQKSLEQIQEESGADAVYPIHELPEKLSEYLIPSDFVYHSFGQDQQIDQHILKALNVKKRPPKKFPSGIMELKEVLQEMRLIKSVEEINFIRRAAEITTEAYKQVAENLAPGMYEYEIEALVHYTFRKSGATPAFPIIVGSGPNSTILHYRENSRRIEAGDAVLLDCGARYQFYCSDVSRVFSVTKEFSPEQQKVYDAVLQTQKQLISEIAPGKSVCDWHDQAVQLLTECMIDLKLLQGNKDKLIEDNSYKKYYPHGLGHWIGLQVHDVGDSYCEGEPRLFTQGMVLTVEPGMYIPQNDQDAPDEFRGIGVRIEDDVLVTSNGYEVLTQNIAK